MEANNHDKAIKELYQQRKQAVIAPNIDLTEEILNERKNNEREINLRKINCRKSSWHTLVIALLGGSLASFGILAVISHLAKAPTPDMPTDIIVKQGTEVEIKRDNLSELTAQAVALELNKIKQGLPELAKTPEYSNAILPAEPHQLPQVKHELLAEQLLLQVKQRELNIKLRYQVMPSISPNQEVATGSVKLSYQVNQLGQVNNIKLLESSAPKSLQKSAIKALSQWQYINNETQEKEYEVQFDFTKP